MKFIDIQQVCNLFHFRLMADNIGARLDDIGRGLCADKAAFLEIVLDLLCLGGVLFENLVDVDDRSIQRLLQEVDSESLLIALKGAEQPLREKFLRNMSQRAADILRDDLANRGPVRLSQVENEQKAILLIVRRLAETGEMVIGSGEDTYV